MIARKYQIFVSSTYSDLIEERQEVIEAIIDLGHIPAGMEGFPAIDIEQFNYIKKVIDQCDYYVLIVAGRYGSLSSDGYSFTEKEYRYAVESGKIVIAFVMDQSAISGLPEKHIECVADLATKLERFKAEVMTNRLVRLWKDRNGLSRAVMKSLIVAFEEFPSEGWVRGSVQANEDILAQINDLRVKNEVLKEENERLKKQAAPVIENIASLDAQFLVHYTYYGAGSSKNTSSVTMIWREIFLAIAPKLAVPQSPSAIALHLGSYLKDSGRIQGRSPGINSVDADRIKIQLVAHGLIKEIHGKSTAGTLGEWVQVSEAGRRVMIENMVIRS